jgi:uncharacterized protein YukE
MSDATFPVDIPGDPDQLAQLSTYFRQTCDVITSVTNRITAISASPQSLDWWGSAAQAFQGKLGELPGEMNSAFASYDAVAAALWSYENSVRDLQGRLSQVRTGWHDAIDQLASVKHARSVSSNPTDPTWDAKEQAAQEDIDRAIDDAQSLSDEFQSAAQLCSQHLDNASSMGIPPDSIWQHVGDIAGDISGVAVNLVIVVGKSIVNIVKEAIDLIPAVVDFVQHPSWQAFGRVMTDLGAVVTIAAIVLGAGLLVGPFLGMAEGALDTAGAVVQIAAEVQGAGQLGAHLGEGKPLWPDVALDVVNVGTLGLGHVSEAAMNLGRPGEGGVLSGMRDPKSISEFGETPWMMDGSNYVASSTPALSRWHGIDGRFTISPSLPDQVAAQARYVTWHHINTLAQIDNTTTGIAQNAVDDPNYGAVDGAGDVIVDKIPDMLGTLKP